MATRRNPMGVAQELSAPAAATNPAAGSRLRQGFLNARSLRQHFYENDPLDDEATQSVDDVLDAVDLMLTLFRGAA